MRYWIAGLWIGVLMSMAACDAAKTTPLDGKANQLAVGVSPADMKESTDATVNDAVAGQAQGKAVDPVEKAVAEIDALLNQKKFREAYAAVVAAETAFGSCAALSAAFDRVYDADPDYQARPREVTNDEVTAVKKLGGGSSLVYRLIKDKKTFAAFKPKQMRKQSNDRSEIAAYRLCPLMRCRFDIPVNHPVWFTYRRFSGLYARIPSNPPDELRELDLVKVDGVDRVVGTQKAWVAEYAFFPIEMENWWKPLFEAPKEYLLKAKAAEMLDAQELQKRHNGTKIANDLVTHFGTLTQYALALQLSNLLVFDFLVNNWDRYSQKEEFWGVNCQFSHGRFMSIDNGASFPQTPNPRPERHLHGIRRFSRLTYEAIGALEHDRTLERLYPDATELEKKRFETFWKQRERYLAYVEGLISEYGESETLFFD